MLSTPVALGARPETESAAVVVAVAPGGPADAAGIGVGDELVAVDGQPIRDIIAYQVAVDGADPVVVVRRGGIDRTVEVAKRAGEPVGLELDAPVFDGVRTCDNHCEFCFIYQLPPGMRGSLSIKDDDFRLSFLYGNFTTLTRFTESDLERVVSECLSPLYVSIHATDPAKRVEMLRNRRGGPSLRWLRALLDHGIEVHGQIVVCPGLNDGSILDDTLCGVFESYPELVDVAVVPLGVSRFNREERMRPHTFDEVCAVLDVVERWQSTFDEVLGRPLVYAADEYYLLAGRDFPPADRYGEFSLHEDGIGMARSFEAELLGHTDRAVGVASGFFASVDGAPAAGYRSPRAGERHEPARSDAPVTILTGGYGAQVLAPLLVRGGWTDVEVLAVRNEFFGGNIAVTGLMCGPDLARELAGRDGSRRYLLPDVCLSGGRFLDGSTPEDLPVPVEVVPTDGVGLRRALERS